MGYLSWGVVLKDGLPFMGGCVERWVTFHGGLC